MMKQITYLYVTYFLTICLLCLINDSSGAEYNNTKFTHLTVKDGLSQSGVMSMYKDSKGYMWFGTRDGLNRYDGYNFKIYRFNESDSNSISGNYIRVIKEDRNGMLWIGTNNGLNAFNRVTEKFTVYQENKSNNTSISNSNIFSVLERQNGDIWVGTEHGLNRLDQTTGEFQKYYNTVHNARSLGGNHVHALFEDMDNNLWIGTKTGGLNKFIDDTNEFIRFTTSSSEQFAISSNFVRAITQTDDGTLWIGMADHGIERLGKTGKIQHLGKVNGLSNELVRYLVPDGDDVWIATYNGLNHYNAKTNTIDVFHHDPNNLTSIAHNSIRAILLDEHDFLWIGTYFGGISILNPRSKQFTHYKHNTFDHNTISYDVVGAMVEDRKGNLWIGTEGGGLNYFNINTKTFSKKEVFFDVHPELGTVKSLLFDSRQNLWIGTHLNGLVRVDFSKGRVTEFTDNDLSNSSILELLEDHTGKFWIGTDRGLNIYDPITERVSIVDLGVNEGNKRLEISTLFEDTDHNIWIGTKSAGMMLYDRGTIKYFLNDPKNKKSLSNNGVYEIFEDSKGQIWIGTYGGGLNTFNRQEETFNNYTLSDGLINDIVYGILEDEPGNLWIMTPGGISKLNPDTGQFDNFNASNGLPITEFNEGSILKHSSGTMFFGGFNGMVSFDPKEIVENSFSPKVVLTDLRLFNEKVSPNDNTRLLKKPLGETGQITFTNKQNIFTLEFIALNYSQFGHSQYAYMLEGLESDWNYVGESRSATYTNLDPGDYTFKVKSANSDGIWNEDILSLKISKLPPFWMTTWAYLLYAIVLGLLFVFGRRYFLVKLKLENNLKLEKLEKQKIEDLTKLKLRFFTNISHDFRTPLTLITGPLQELLQKTHQPDIQSHLMLIRKNVNLMLRLINQLMDFRKLESGRLSLKLTNEPIVPFIREIAFSFKEHAKQHHIKYLFSSEFSDKNIWFDKDKIEKVLFNILSNAFKNTDEKGIIAIEIDKSKRNPDADFLEICIRNSGHGIAEKDLNKIFDRFYTADEKLHASTGIGLALCKELIELHKGYIEAKSELDQYTEFIVGIPLKDIYQEQEKIQPINEKQTDDAVLYKPEQEQKKQEVRKDKTHTLLIVEDNADLRNYLAQIFRSQYNIITANDGQMGWDCAQQHHIDVVLSDIMMPKMSGIELCKKLKENTKTQHLPVVLITARTADSIKLDSYNLGADDFISKPFDIDILKSKIHNLVTLRTSLNTQARNALLLEDQDINQDGADEKFLEVLSNYIRENISDRDLNVNKISHEIGISRVHLFRKVKAITGKSPVDFLKEFRLAVAAKLLEQDTYNINEICYKTGYNDVSYFRKCFKRRYGLSATQYADRIRKTEINS